jgi:hypothetical protein
VTSGNKVYNLSVTHNRFFAYGGAVVQSWAGSAEDNGGNVCDYNEYHGAFATTKGVTTHNLGQARAAWASYGDGSNDSHSRAGRRLSGSLS